MIHDSPGPALQRQRSFTLDPVEYTVRRDDGRIIELTPAEYRLLHYLITNAGQLLPARKILNVVWGCDAKAASNLVPVYMRRLRVKLEIDPERPRHIVTIRKKGYMFSY